MIELERPREPGALLRDSLAVYRRHFWTFLALGAVVVVPSDLLVSGVGLAQLDGRYDPSPEVTEQIVPGAVTFLVVGPLITAFCVFALRSVADGEAPRARETAVRGFELFAPLLLAVALTAIGIAFGLLLLVAPGVYLFVRWYFVPQAVVLEDARATGALRASWRLVEGAWWRAFGLIVLIYLATLLVAVVIATPFAAAAEATDRALWSLIGQIAANSVTQPFAAIYSTLLYHDLRKRVLPS